MGFQHVENMFPNMCFSLTLFWKHIFNMLKRLDYQKDSLDYQIINFLNPQTSPKHYIMLKWLQIVFENDICSEIYF